MLKDLSYTTYSDVREVPELRFFTCLNLVFPEQVLKSIHATLTHHGKLVIEVPHAGDFLLEVYFLVAAQKCLFEWCRRNQASKFYPSKGFRGTPWRTISIG